MTVRDLRGSLDPGAAGAEMHERLRQLFPLCRSITGPGVRETLAILDRVVGGGLTIREVPTGTPVLDWEVPREWSVREAWIKDPLGRTVVDFRDSNLHLVGYSAPVHRRLPLAELAAHLHTLPEHPDWIPYRTSYYQEAWGFCLPHRTFEGLAEGEYEVKVDSRLEAGHLTYGELFLPGETDREVLISAHVCHPSMANDNLSGLLVAAFLARLLRGAPRRHGYRFLFAPGTIGAITWLAANEGRLGRIRHGLVAALLGLPGGFTYKKTRRGDAEIDRAVARAFADAGRILEVRDFTPTGYDERQYGSPGFDLPVGSLSRRPWGEYPEYHTSADDAALVRPEALGESLAACLEVVTILEENGRYRNLAPKGEPQLGRRGLYRSVGGGTVGREPELALLWVLNLSDGRHDLLAIAERAGMPFAAIRAAADALLAAELLEELEDGDTRREKPPPPAH